MKKHKHIDRIQQTTVIFGYTLFALYLLVIVIFTVIPFGSMFSIPATNKLNIALILGSLIAGAVLPTLISYYLGDKSTKTKSKLDHHFNGVLFGIAAYWLSNLFSIISAEAIQAVRDVYPEPLATLINSWPIFATVLVMTIVAIRYVRQTATKKSLLEFRPYQFALLGSIVAIFAYSLAYGLFQDSGDYMLSALYSLVVPLSFFGLSFVTLSNLNVSKQFRITLSAVALSIGYISFGLTAQLLVNVPYYTGLWWLLAVGFLATVAYLLFIRQTTRK